ncbi:hypothetical protein [Lactobacillus corticis]|uniref:Uncharacterized protein n=1 Tax=Lactobacillus corticis TaxID=2201249 RepID=A0A916QIW2_9LACO|nr:hypothetical protein [Lactobacillus corticis]GFZ27248.1 hypothetical protein LCB40_11280 [Lactobacillus corticis]
MDQLIQDIASSGFYHDKGYISTSKEIYDNDDYFRMVITRSKTGRDVKSFRSDENEVLFARGTTFKFVKQYIEKGKIFVEVEEID